MKTFILAICIFGSLNVKAQDYQWFEGTCSFTGEINDELATREELDNIVGLLLNPNSLSQPVFRIKPEDSKYIVAQTVEMEANNFIKELESARFPENEIWDSLRKIRINALKREAELKLLAISAMSNPKILKQDAASYLLCKNSVSILCAKPKKIVKAYRKIYGEEEYKRLQYTSGTIDEMSEMASIDFLRYEWWNCASTTIHDIQNHSIISSELQLLLLHLKKDCH